MSGKSVVNENITFVEDKDYIYQNKFFQCKMNWKNVSHPLVSNSELIEVSCNSKKQPDTYFRYKKWCTVSKNKGIQRDGESILEVDLVEKLEGFSIGFICQGSR